MAHNSILVLCTITVFAVSGALSVGGYIEDSTTPSLDPDTTNRDSDTNKRYLSSTDRSSDSTKHYSYSSYRYLTYLDRIDRYPQITYGGLHHYPPISSYGYGYGFRPYGYDPQPSTIVETTTGLMKEYKEDSRAYKQNKLYHVSEDPKDWFDARDECKKKGLELVSLSTRTKRREFEDYLEKQDLSPWNKYSGYWIGGHRVHQEEPWIWESNDQDIIYFNWLPLEPNGDDGENCIEFIKNELGITGWNNYYCSAMRRFICEGPYEALKNSTKKSKGDKVHEEERKQGKPENTSSKFDDDYDEDYSDYEDSL